VQGLKSRFAGHSAGDVKNIAREVVGQLQDVQVSQSIPFFVLPFFSGRIEVKQQVVPQSPNR
jgi:hypothetical protein